jgi:hypothetical protein
MDTLLTLSIFSGFLESGRGGGIGSAGRMKLKLDLGFGAHSGSAAELGSSSFSHAVSGFSVGRKFKESRREFS